MVRCPSNAGRLEFFDTSEAGAEADVSFQKEALFMVNTFSILFLQISMKSMKIDQIYRKEGKEKWQKVIQIVKMKNQKIKKSEKAF